MIKAITSFFTYALLALGAENVVFTRGLGISNGLRTLSNPQKDTIYFCVSLTGFQFLNSILAYFLVPVVYKTPLRSNARFITPVVIVFCCAVSYILVVTLLGSLVNRTFFKRIILSLTGASMNSAIVGTILYSVTSGFTFSQTVGFAIGSSIGYFIAMLLIAEGEKKIHSEYVPRYLQGLPITLIYISIIALAIYGLTGHTMAL